VPEKRRKCCLSSYDNPTQQQQQHPNIKESPKLTAQLPVESVMKPHAAT